MVYTVPGADFSLKLNKIVSYVERTNVGGFLFYSCDNTALLLQINRAIIERAKERDIYIEEFLLSIEETGHFLSEIRKTAGNNPDGIMIFNIDESIVYTKDQIIKDINNARDILLGFKIPILFGMSAENISKFANQAQDLFLRRDRGVIRFAEIASIPGMEESDDARESKKMRSLKPGTPDSFRLRVELMERQFKAVEKSKVKPERIANEFALELMKAYLQVSSVNKAKELFEKYKFYFNLENHLKSIESVAELYRQTSQWDNALELLFKSKKIHEDINDVNGLSGVLYDIANIYYNKGCISEALEYYRETGGILKTIGDQKRLAFTLNTIGNIEYERGRRDKALENYLKSKEIFVELGDETNQKIVDENIQTIKEKLQEKEAGL